MGIRAAPKFILISIGLVLIAIGVSGTFLLAQAQSALKKSAGDMLTDVFDQSVSVGGVFIDPFQRALVLSDFRLDNPDGFKEGPMLEIPFVHIIPEWSYLFTDEPSIERITLNNADIYFRFKFGDGSNLGAFADKIEERGSSEKTITVNEIVAEDAEFHFANAWIPSALMDFELVDIHIQDVGDGESLTPGKVVSIFLRSVVNEAVTLKGLLETVISPRTPNSESPMPT